MTACPSPEHLQRLLVDQLDDSERASVEAHLETCAACQQAMELLTPVSEHWQRREGSPAQVAHDAAFLQRLAAEPAQAEFVSVDGSSKETMRPASHDPIAPPPGYELLNELGRGATGTVYRARQRDSNRLVALKILKPCSRANSMLRFRREVEALIWLQHPQLVRIYEVGQHQGRPYFAMELIEGGDLARKFAEGSMSPWAAARLLTNLARGIQAAHENGLVHRDLKPANVLLAADDQPKIVDFGLAKHVAGDRPATTLGSIIGTPAYMAPEQAWGRVREIGPAADIYSLGAILYQALTGRPPFIGTAVQQVLDQVRRAEPAPPRLLRPEVPAELEGICLKCLQKDPGHRYASAQELADDLNNFLGAAPERVGPVIPVVTPGVSSKRPPHKRALPVGVALVGTGLAGALVVAAVGLLAPEPSRPRAAYSSESRPILAAAPTNLVAAASLPGNMPSNSDATRPPVTDRPAPAGVRLPEECPAPRLLSVPRADKPTLWQKNRRLVAQGPVRMFAFSPDAKVVACGASQWVQAWELESARSRFAIVGHSSPVTALAFSADGSTLVSGSADGTARIHESINGTVNLRVDPKAKSNTAALSCDGTLMAVGLGQRVRVREVRTDKQVSQSPLTDAVANCMAFSPGGDTLALAGVDLPVIPQKLPMPIKKGKGKGAAHPPAPEEPERWIRLLDPQTGETRRTLSLGKSILCLAFSPDGTVLASAGQGPTILIWKTANRKETYELETRGGWVTSLAYSPDGKTLAAGSEGGTVELWDWVAGERLQTLTGHSAAIFAVAFAPDGQTLVSGCSDGTICIWKPRETR